VSKLTVNQVAAKIEKTSYTIKRWYTWYENLTDDEKIELFKKGMPKLPAYETVGTTKWRYWDEKDIPQIRKFSKWVPHTRGGVMGNLNKKEK
jgi:hypothetical protein